jgi:hypothetical protein
LHMVRYPILLVIEPRFPHHLPPKKSYKHPRMCDMFRHNINGYQIRICSVIPHADDICIYIYIYIYRLLITWLLMCSMANQNMVENHCQLIYLHFIDG